VIPRTESRGAKLWMSWGVEDGDGESVKRDEMERVVMRRSPLELRYGG